MALAQSPRRRDQRAAVGVLGQAGIDEGKQGDQRIDQGAESGAQADLARHRPGVDADPSAPGVDGEPPLSHRPGAWASPVAPVQAGGGGAAELVAAEERGAGPGTAQGVTGLVLAGVAAVVVALRGLRRGRGTD